ncbi:hypothetical protein [Jeotgalibaca porci]|uniref:hypothetical protein n=1 Tax=Jeotgalibaca porci TaxID=1868793 RepID=UPI00359F6FF5
MIYIPTPWLINPNNEDKVRELLENLNQDLITDDLLTETEVISELEKLGETIIIEKLNNNEMAFGA